MPDNDNRDMIVKLALLGGGGFAAYKFLYLPYAYRQEVLRRTEEEAARLAAQGMSLETATQKALAGACVGAAAVYKVPPNVSAGICEGVGVLAQKGLELTAKGAVIAGKAIGSGVKTGVLAVGSGVATGVKAVGSAAVTTGKAVGTAAKFVGYTAPKAVIYDAPKAVITTVGSGVATGAKAVGSAVVSVFGGGSSEVCRSGVGGHGGKAVYPNDLVECKNRYGITDCKECGKKFNLTAMKWPWQIDPSDGYSSKTTAGKIAAGAAAAMAAPAPKKPPVGKPAGFRGLGDMVAAAKAARRQLGGGARPVGNPFAEHARRRDSGKVAPGRKRRSLAGLSGAAPARRATGAEFYTRHLK